MKKQTAVAAIALACFGCASSTVGCASSSYSHGRNFDEKQISKIEKGKTTATEILALFGQPYEKNVVSANEEKWKYLYMQGVVTAQSAIFVTSTSVKGTNKILDVLLKDGIVTNFTYSDGPYGGSTSAPATSEKQ